MEGTITVSPSEIVGMLLGLCAALGTLSVGITSVTKFLKWKNRPINCTPFQGHGVH